MRIRLAFLLSALVLPPGAASGQTWSPEQQEIWRLENQQWDMIAAKDTSWLQTMVHPNVSIWETDHTAPQNRASLPAEQSLPLTVAAVQQHRGYDP